MTTPFAAPFAARVQVDQLRRAAGTARAAADEARAVARHMRDRANAGQTTTPTQADAAAGIADGLDRTAEDLANQLAAAEDALGQALDAGPPLFSVPSGEPVVLLPVRLETVFTDDRTLLVRVYPDDLHLSGFEPALTPAEAAAGAAYWAAPGPDAWSVILRTLAPARAAWAGRASRPGAPPPTVRADDARPQPRVRALPDQWRFVGLTAGEVVVDATARHPVADPLPVGPRQGELGWEVDWFAAVKAGMAAELTLPPDVDHLDQLIAVGLRDEPPAAAGARLGELLTAHAYGAGLALLPAGTCTNNTPRERSGWSSRPDPPVSGEDPPPGSRPVADALATALGLPDTEILQTCAGADDPMPAAVAGLSLLTWATLGRGFADEAVTHYELQNVEGDEANVRATDSARGWRAVRDHLADHVRSRGPLPTLRIGRQPYGVLPVSTLSDWRADRDRDADALIAPWLRSLRELWRGAVEADEGIPRVRPGVPADQVAVDVLTRLPVASGLAMRRMYRPAFTFPRTSPDEPPATPGIPRLAPDGGLRWTTPSDGWTDLGWGLDPATERPLFAAAVAAQDPAALTAALLASADRLRDARLFLAGRMSATEHDLAWPVELDTRPVTPPRRQTLWDLPAGTGLFGALLFLPAWSQAAGDDGDDDPPRQALAVPDAVDQLVINTLDDAGDDDRTERIAAATRWAPAMQRLETALLAVAAVPPAGLPELLAEVLDVYSHRLDAWITSLASLRLARARSSGTSGVRLGGYGWVEDVRPNPLPDETVDLGEEDGNAIIPPQDTYGYIHAPSLQQAATAAVLRSGFLAHPGEKTFAVNLTSRRARVARWLLAGVRGGQSLGTLLGYRFERALHDAGLDGEIRGFRLAYPAPTVAEPPGPPADPTRWGVSTQAIAERNVVDGMALARAVADGTVAAANDEVGPHLADLTDALDAVGDLLLAESVHHLVGGNPLRAGLAADALGSGEDLPDTFEVLRTPHRGRAVTDRLAVVCGETPGPTGWPEDAVAKLHPGVEAWVARLLGPASGWTVVGPAGPTTADRMPLGALALVLDAAATRPDRAAAALGGPVVPDGGDWPALRTLAVRIRELLAGAQPLLPEHLPGGSGALDLTRTRARVAAFAATVAGLAVPDLAPNGDPGAWLVQVRAALGPALGVDVPVLPAWTTAAPVARADVPGADIADWLRRWAAVRPPARALHEVLILAGGRSGSFERLCVAQDPDGPGEAWIGGPFPAATRPSARAHLAWQVVPATGPLCGLLLDEWVDVVPGADAIRDPAAAAPSESELTGVAFNYDRPDAKAPHAILVAVPPDTERGWTADGLVQVLRETLELGKLRAVDLDDLGPVGAVLPAARTSAVDAAGQVLAARETPRPGTDTGGPFRFELGYRTSDVEAGLAARVHDPLWFLTRQWQFGEFTGQNAGSPAIVRIRGTSAHVDAWRPFADPHWVRFDPAVRPLDALVEAEDPVIDERLRAEGGVALLRMLAEAGLPATVPAALLMPPDVGESPIARLGGRVPDGKAVAAAIDAGTAPAAWAPVTTRWRAWWTGATADAGPDCFNPNRFEHAVALSGGGSVFVTQEYVGDGLDWFSVDHAPDAEAAAERPRYQIADESLPTTVRFGGLSADRFWEMEDARIDLSATDVSALDTGRLLLIAFATVYGNDWFMAPLEVPCSSLTVLDRILVRDVFNRSHLLPRAGRSDDEWAMFTAASPEPDDPAASGMLMLPTARGQAGEPLERVVLLRDELANLAWAVQNSYTNGQGEPVDRLNRWLATVPPPAPTGDLPFYTMRTTVPDHWYPLVPQQLAPGAIQFLLAATAPPGRLLSAGLAVPEEEVPREGAALGRLPVLARWFDGSWHGWTRRMKGPGTGPGSSGLGFDLVRPTEPWPD